jgi:glutamate dehydrogenase/leucine dehydrogenase
VPTALGVVRGMEAALAHLGEGDLRGKSVAVQGLGHVGEPLAGFLVERGVARIVGSDVDAARVEAMRRAFPEHAEGFRVAGSGDHGILAEAVDVVAPCATGGTLNPRTIPTIRARIVCGAANNQLEDPMSDDRRLRERGVLYVPDFLVNRMGIVNCADEDVGSFPDDPRLARHLGESWESAIYPLARAVLEHADREGMTPHSVALEMAEKRSFEPHPLWGHRGAQIIGALREGWSLLP